MHPVSRHNSRMYLILRLIQKLVATLNSDGTPGQVGGGTLPKVAVPSATLSLSPTEIPLAELSQRLRHGTPPVIGTTAGNSLRLSLRTILPSQDTVLVQALKQALQST